MVAKLKKIPLFAHTDVKALEDLIHQNEIIKKSYHKGMTVHVQGSSCSAIHVVASGKLVAYSLASNGSESIIFEFGSGSVIGANLLLGDQNKYPMNIYCTHDCTVFQISKTGISQLLKQYEFVMPFVKSLSTNSQGMNQKIAMYTQKTLRENITDYLMALSTQQESKIITLPISKKQLADYLGVQRPSLFRELKSMKDEGLIKVDNRKVTLLYPFH